MENSITLLTILVIIFGVVALLLPFFVLKIRNQTVSINRKLSKIIEILDNTAPKAAQSENPGKEDEVPLEYNPKFILVLFALAVIAIAAGFIINYFR